MTSKIEPVLRQVKDLVYVVCPVHGPRTNYSTCRKCPGHKRAVKVGGVLRVECVGVKHVRA